MSPRYKLSLSVRVGLGLVWPLLGWLFGFALFVALTKGHPPVSLLEWLIVLAGLAITVAGLWGSARLVNGNWIEKDAWMWLAIFGAPAVIALAWSLVASRHHSGL